MRRMSFSLTTPQYLDGSKDVTRRGGWAFLKVGDHVMAIEKGMGLKKGEKQVELGPFEVLNLRQEPLHWITQDDVRREGFPLWGPARFVEFYCKANRVRPATPVQRIEFRRL